MPLEIVRNDIVAMPVDVVVNAANSNLQAGGGVSGAIFAAAGAEQLQAACDCISHCPVGGAVVTPGFNLPARYIIHTVGPIWQDGSGQEEALLRSCYQQSLLLARQLEADSIAFPLLSAGAFGYPKGLALTVAISSIGDFLLAYDDLTVYLVVFDQTSYRLSEELYDTIASYIDCFYVEERLHRYDSRRSAFDSQFRQLAATEERTETAKQSTDEAWDIPAWLLRPRETFSQMLLRLIDASGKSDPEIYKRANLDRKLFSKIRSNPAYHPSKNTALALAVALELNLDQTKDLLSRAGFAFSPSSRGDLIVEYFITTGRYNIFEINEALFAFEESTLGA